MDVTRRHRSRLPYHTLMKIDDNSMSVHVAPPIPINDHKQPAAFYNHLNKHLNYYAWHVKASLYIYIYTSSHIHASVCGFMLFTKLVTFLHISTRSYTQ